MDHRGSGTQRDPAVIGNSPGAGRADALEIGEVSDGSMTAGGVVRPGSGVAAAGSAPGLVTAGVSAGLVNVASGNVAGAVVKGALARLGVVNGDVPNPDVVNGDVPNPDVVNGDVPNPDVVNGAVPSPGVNVVGALEPEPVNRLVGIGGRLIPNCDRPCDSADISSLGRSVTIAAWTNWRCCVGGLAFSDRSDMATIAAGLATARAATALMAVESLRRRRFGTEVSSIYGLRLVGARLISDDAVSGYGLDRAEPISADVIDGTGVTAGAKVAIRNCEPIATFGPFVGFGVGEASQSDTLAADDRSF